MSKMSRREFTQAAGAAALLAACGGGGGGGGAGAAGAARPDSTPGGAPAPAAKPKPLKLLVLGGTGFLGPEFVEVALARGHTVTLFNRGKTNAALFPELEKLKGDRDGQLDALRGRQWDAVLDTSGYVPRVVRMSAELLAPNVGHYVFISSISAYADPVPAHADERTPTAKLADPASEDVPRHYGALKAACEAAAEAAMPGRVSNVRPGLIVGPGDPTDRFTYWPARIARGGEVLAPSDGSDPVQWIDARDLGAWLVKVVEDEAMGVFNAVGPGEPATIKAMLEGCKQGVGGDASFTWVPARFLEEKQVMPWVELPVWTGGELGFATIDARRALAAGLRFRPVAETARDTAAWWKALPEERKAKPRAGLDPAKEAEVLAAWNAGGGKAK